MAFFQDLGKKISNATQDAAKKTSELIETSKLNSAINTEKNTISDLQRKIGAAVYSLFEAGEAIPESLQPDVQSIAGHLSIITGLEQKIADIKAASAKPQEEPKAAAPSEPAAETPAEPAAEAPAEPAPEAPAEPAPEAPAEPAPEAPAETPSPAPAKRFCTNCGAPLVPGMVFCGQCGTKNG